MTTRARAYRATHAPDQAYTSPLPILREALHGGPPTPQQIASLADQLNMPVAALRGALTSFDDTRIDPHAVRVCAGTSCLLAGGASLSRQLASRSATHPVYCLGYCDRSPAAMTPDGHVIADLRPDRLTQLTASGTQPHPAPPSVRCIARHSIVTRRLLDPRSPDECPDYTGLQLALAISRDAVLSAIEAAGVKGRGGAAFPTARKLRMASQTGDGLKFIVANGDEGDPGSFIDRELMERDPHGILEGMTIAAHAVGAQRGIVFIRSEYPVSVAAMNRAIAAATARGFLGPDALGPDKPFLVEVLQGMGSYVCGEETALLAAIEGQRGEVWPRPPFPVQSGLFSRPTVVDNVETLVNLPWILEHGVDAYTAMGTADSRGTKALCFNRGFANPGIVEVEFGLPLHDAITILGGGDANRAELDAVLLGGPMGSIVPPEHWDAPICFSAMSRRGINLGHGGLVAIPRSADWNAILAHLLTFMRDESCGKCVPCRLGTRRLHELVCKQHVSPSTSQEVRGILGLMSEASLCAFGRETPGPVRTILERFADRLSPSSAGGRP